MSTNAQPDTNTPATQEEMIAAMFANMVIQHTNMAAVFLGLAPNPQTNETKQELDHARYFIDQLEMLQVKTKGNLSKEEEAMLNQSLSGLRMAFVAAINTSATAEKPAPNPADEPMTEADDDRKKFSKKY